MTEKRCKTLEAVDKSFSFLILLPHTFLHYMFYAKKTLVNPKVPGKSNISIYFFINKSVKGSYFLMKVHIP